MEKQDQAAWPVVSTFCQKHFSGLGCFFMGERGISSQILWSTPVCTFGVSGRGMLENSQRLFPFRPFGSPPEPLTTSELRGMWWIFAFVWFPSSSTPAGGQCPAETVGVLLISLILPTFVQLTPSTINSWVLNIFLYFLPVKQFPLAWIHQESIISGPSCSCLSEQELQLAGSRTHLVELI